MSPTVRFRCLSIPSTGSAVYLRARTPRCVASILSLVTGIVGTWRVAQFTCLPWSSEHDHRRTAV